MRQLLYTGMLLLMSASIFAQAPLHKCGTDDEALIQGLLDNKRALLNSHATQRSIEYIPIKFHVTAKSDGSERINLLRVLAQLKEINEDFEDVGFQFYMPDSEMNLLNNTAVYSNHFSTIFSTMSVQKDNQALNVWIVESADDGTGEGTTLAYYSPGRDWIVMDQTYVREDDPTLAHEIGHFFDLPHPFRGWGSGRDEEDWLTPAPAISPGGVPTEKADGSNCETAGDLICDTAADYNLGFGWPDCNFTGIVLDPMGDTLNPDERLYMGYFLNCADDEYYFSDMQTDIMIQDYSNGNRNYLRQGPNPFFDDITEEVEGVSPEKDEITASFDNITFSWTPVQNATRYLFELSEFSSFTTSNTMQIIVETSSYTMEEALEADERYYWRVTPYNDMKCGETMDDIRFETGLVSSNNEPEFVNAHRISPNPVNSGQNLLLELDTEEAFNGSWELFDLSGRQIGPAQALRFQAGSNQMSLPTAQLPTGVYMWRLQTESGRLSGRLVVTK